MDPEYETRHRWLSRPTLYPERATWLRRFDALAQIVGVAAAIVGHGLRHSGVLPWEFGLVLILAMLTISVCVLLRYRWSLARASFPRRHAPTVLAAAVWIAGMILVIIFAPLLPDVGRVGGARYWGGVYVSEFVLLAYAVTGTVRGLRKIAAESFNPAFLLAGSFLLLITIGTIMLMLPISRFPDGTGPPVARASFLTALFTATSASCVTGLVVVDTGTYWSRIGQIVILLLMQIGGLGIMTFSAFFAVLGGKSISLGELATIRDLVTSEGMGSMRRLVLSILGFTLISELIGAVLLFPLFADLPLRQQIFMSVFHSVSAFCNAGFALTDNSFVGMGESWRVWGVVALLIIIGGMGFVVLYNLTSVTLNILRRWLRPQFFRTPQTRVRLRLTTRLVLITTLCLLFLGTVGVYLLERTVVHDDTPISLRDAWFQSVTFRTAGFNTVDIGELQPATKLLGVLLMVIGASPGSTGGGIKTIVFAVAVVGLLSVLRGRDRVETFGRTIPAVIVNRALAIVLVSLATIMTATILLVLFEQRPELFLDHLFEATSAGGTVGLSTTVPLPDGEIVSTTKSLSSASRLVLIVTMFLGRIGPLTLLLALAGEAAPVRYDYPPERVTLG